MIMPSNVLLLTYMGTLDFLFWYPIIYLFLPTKGEREDNFIIKVFDKPTEGISLLGNINSLIYLFYKNTSSIHPCKASSEVC